MQIKVAKSYSKHFLSSKKIRDTFLDYFIKDNGHKFIRSSPVVPFCDPSIAFVNAGMNQFKNIFLGKHSASTPKAANSQKCIRVGGKHNDLDVVGTDGYHHTFFEMLGNWSFGDYFKKEACLLAYNLLTGPYRINPNRLYFTYFSGDESLGLQPDLECRDIWREIGVPQSRIIPFGKGDNFWEMGSSGPCGPCTEIHYDHIGTRERPQLVNSGVADLTELWNIVFIQYNRHDSDGSLGQLSQKFIDTGMGLERLVALLQGKDSNYETDLFMPIFDEIYRNAKGVDPFTDTQSFELQRDYRVVADHSRLITACIADKLFPDNNHKLRRILRKILLISGKTFGNEKLIHATVQQVAEILGDTYPEIQNLNDIQKVIDHEIEVYSALRKEVTKSIRHLPFSIMDLIEHDLLDYPGSTIACRDILAARTSWAKDGDRFLLPTDYAFKLYDTYGLNVDAIDRMSALMKFSWRQEDLFEALSKLKVKSRKFGALTNREKLLSHETVENIHQSYGVVRTDDSFKYEYTYDDVTKSFACPPQQAKVLASLPDLEDVNLFHIITDKTNFYVESGGQESDIGLLSTDSCSFNVIKVTEENGFVIHSGYFEKSDSTIREGDAVELRVNPEKRTGNTRHHTATHLLNATVRQLFSAPTCQKSSDVQNQGLKLELSIYGPRLTRDCFVKIEQTVRGLVKQGAPVVTRTINSQQLLELINVTTVPGDIYPDDGIRLVEIQPGVSLELCCGTHCRDVSQLIDFCLLNVKLQGRASYVFTAVVGETAQKAHQLGHDLLEKAQALKDSYTKENVSVISQQLKELFDVISRRDANGIPIPYNAKQQVKTVLEAVEMQCRVDSREALRNWVDQEMKQLTESHSSAADHPFIVHLLENSFYSEAIPLEGATKYFEDRPVMLISYSNNIVGARCHVPQSFQSDDFNAEKWIKIVADIFCSQVEGQKKASCKSICSMKERKYEPVEFREKVKEALIKSNEIAKLYVLK